MIEKIKERETSPLCTRCGLCCVMLSAKLTEEEAEKFEEVHGISQDAFCKREEAGVGPNEGELVIKMPCRYLLGKPMSYVSCRAYQAFRPEVCGAYLCKVAVGYKIGSLDLQPALKLLRAAFWTGDASIFNWTGGEGEDTLLRAAAVPKLRAQAKEIYDVLPVKSTVSLEELESFLIAKHITPVYDFVDQEAHFEFNMLMNIFDRDELDSEDLFGKRNTEREDKRELDKIVLKVVSSLRKYFKIVE